MKPETVSEDVEREAFGILQRATLVLIMEAEAALHFVDRHWSEHEMLPEDMEANPDGLSHAIDKARRACSANSPQQIEARATQTKAGDVEAVARAMRDSAYEDGYVFLDDDLTATTMDGNFDFIDMAKAAIAAMPQASEWMPISSAPKAKSILVCVKATEENQIFRGQQGVYQAALEDGAWMYGNIKLENGKWAVTHWMPLPAPPSGLAREGLCTKS